MSSALLSRKSLRRQYTIFTISCLRGGRVARPRLETKVRTGEDRLALANSLRKRLSRKKHSLAPDHACKGCIIYLNLILDSLRRGVQKPEVVDLERTDIEAQTRPLLIKSECIAKTPGTR